MAICIVNNRETAKVTRSSIVSRSASLLDQVCASSEPMTFTQLVVGMGLPKSSVHRLISVLLARRLVVFR